MGGNSSSGSGERLEVTLTSLKTLQQACVQKDIRIEYRQQDKLLYTCAGNAYYCLK